MATLKFKFITAGIYHRRDLTGHVAVISRIEPTRWAGAIFKVSDTGIVEESVFETSAVGMRKVALALNEAASDIMIERQNAVTGEKFMEAIDTPHYCSPSSETYWSA